ncbi:MAG: hypothetical protein RKH07_16195 [Gammaproteobacteria bacterium]
MTRRSPLVIALIVISLLVVLFASGVWRQYSMDDAARTLTLRVVEDTLSSGTAQTLIEYAHPDLLTAIPAESLNAYVASIPRALGDLEALTTLSGGADIPLLPFGSTPSVAQFTVGLMFAEAPGEARITLTRLNEQWRVTSYDIASPLLAN